MGAENATTSSSSDSFSLVFLDCEGGGRGIDSFCFSIIASFFDSSLTERLFSVSTNIVVESSDTLELSEISFIKSESSAHCSLVSSRIKGIPFGFKKFIKNPRTILVVSMINILL